MQPTKETGEDVDTQIIPHVTSDSVIDVDVLYGGGYAIRAIPTEEMDTITSIVTDPQEVSVEAASALSG